MKSYRICFISCLIFGASMITLAIGRGKTDFYHVLPFTLGVLSAGACALCIFMTRKQKEINKLLMVDCNPNAYLEKMNRLEQQAYSEKFRRLIKINIAAGLIYSGEVEQAVSILQSIALKGLSPMHKGVYYNNLAFAYLMMNNTQEAQNIFKDHIGEMLAAEREFTIQSCARCTQAILDYKQNRKEIARETLDRLLKKELQPLQKSVALYYKGLILNEEGSISTIDTFKESARYGGDTIFGKLSIGAVEGYY